MADLIKTCLKKVREKLSSFKRALVISEKDDPMYVCVKEGKKQERERVIY